MKIRSGFTSILNGVGFIFESNVIYYYVNTIFLQIDINYNNYIMKKLNHSLLNPDHLDKFASYKISVNLELNAFLLNFNFPYQSIYIANYKHIFSFNDSISNNSTPSYDFAQYNLKSKSITKITIQWKKPNVMFGSLLTIYSIIYVTSVKEHNMGLCTSLVDSSFAKIPAKANKLINLQTFIKLKGGRGFCNYKGIYIFALCGGIGEDVYNSCEKYTITQDTWSVFPRANEEKSGVSCIAIGNQLYMIGGFCKKGALLTIEKIDILQAKSWIIMKLQGAPLLHSCFPLYLGDLKMLVFGANIANETKGYIADLRKRSVTMAVALQKCVKGSAIRSSLQSFRHHYYATESTLIKFDNDANVLSAINFEGGINNWPTNLNIIGEL